MSPSSSLAQIKNTSAIGAFVIQFLEPFKMYFPPWSLARVSMLLMDAPQEHKWFQYQWLCPFTKTVSHALVKSHNVRARVRSVVWFGQPEATDEFTSSQSGKVLQDKTVSLGQSPARENIFMHAAHRSLLVPFPFARPNRRC